MSAYDLSKEQEVNALNDIHDGLRNALDTREYFGRTFPEDDNRWVTLRYWIGQCMVEVEKMLENRKPMYQVIGIASPNNRIYPPYHRDVINKYETEEEAEAYIVEETKLQHKDGIGRAAWWFFIQEVNNG